MCCAAGLCAAQEVCVPRRRSVGRAFVFHSMFPCFHVLRGHWSISEIILYNMFVFVFALGN